ncbi:MAG: hypothetical protein ACI85O_000963 [Saprospiraceae bacterium]|jgi:hypothetical protein
MKHFLPALLLLISCTISYSQEENTNQNRFRQLYNELPTPNVYRTASGAPGHQYWQQKADYQISIELDDDTQRIYGEETITYTNNSPDRLSYLWVQLDQNRRAKDSDTYKVGTSSIQDKMTFKDIKNLEPWFDGGFKLDYVQGMDGRDLHYSVVKTMMRVDMPEVLESGKSFSFKIKWWYNINDRKKGGGRSGLEYFAEEDNYIYTIAQFFPRMAVYIDNEGWQNKQFLGRGEFTLPFGDYEVNITVPADHAVAATGIIQNENDVLTKVQQERLEKAKQSFEEPVYVITPDEAKKAEKSKAKTKKTWTFKAENVRDFAFSSSRKFMWDAMAVKQSDGTTVIAASMFPKEGNPLWERYSTKTVAHTLKWYSHYTFDYPYPIAWSIHTDRIGMEYPMICFNGGRPEADGTYTKRTKYGLIGVIIHEVGHNYFPMIVNSDERQWTWMDEGLNTYLQYLTEQEWERDYPSRRGPAANIVDYMKGDKNRIAPIMINSESIFQFGNNAYGKPATGLNILRETIVGREDFDFAFKEYSRRWMLKHPTPADFFRTIEDATAVDLDWFWRAWFFTNDHTDIALEDVKYFQISSGNPDIEKPLTKQQRDASPQGIGSIRNEKAIAQTQDEKDRKLRDFYTDYDPLDVDALDKNKYKKYINNLSSEEKTQLGNDKYYYEITFRNIGGIPMPLIVEFQFTDGTSKTEYIPAEIWRYDAETVTKVFVQEKEVTQIILDPRLETADTDISNNYFPAKSQISKFELFKQKKRGGENPMQRAERAKKMKN